MTPSTHEEERLSSIASLSQPFSLKSGTFELPHNSALNNPEIIPTSEPTLTPPFFSTNTKPLPSSPKSRHSLAPPPTNLQVTIDNVTYIVPSKRTYNTLEDPVSIDSGILPHVIQPVKNPSQTNSMTDELLRAHPNFKTNLPFSCMTLTSYKIRFPQDRRFDHYVACSSKNLEQLSLWQNKHMLFFQFQFNFIKPTQHHLNTTPNNFTTAPSVKKNSTTKPTNFFLHKNTNKYSFFKTTNLLHLSRTIITTR